MVETGTSREQVAHVKRMLRELMQHIRKDVEKVADPRAQALLETSAETLGGLIKAYEHYEKKAEPAWRA